MWTLLLSRIENPRTYIDRRQIDGGQIKIGRAVNRCDWVIPDHDGYVSREHCTLIVSGLDLYVLDTSTYGTVLNDGTVPIPPNQPIAVRVNDRLTVGDYIIEIAPEGAMAGAPLAAPPPAPMPGGGTMGKDDWFQSAADPIWNPGVRDAEVHEFLNGSGVNDFLGISSAQTPAHDFNGIGGIGLGEAFTKPIMMPFDPGPGAFDIPENWNFAPAPAPPQSDARGAFQDARFDPLPVDLAGFDDLLVPPAVAARFDAPPHAPAPTPVNGSDPFADFFAPLEPPPATPAPAQPPALSGPAAFDHVTPPAPAPADDIFADFFAPGGVSASPPEASPDPVMAPLQPALPPAVPVPAPRAATTPDAEADWAAFCEGAGISLDELRRSPDAMRRLGVLYRQVVLGLSDLVRDRAAFKSEFRMEATMLAMGRNNPLKMLDPVDTARLLLADPLPGFMPADEAVRAAFEDIKKHQMAMLAGVQHALTAVFKRLAPAEIERLKEKAEGERRGLPFKRGVDAWTVYRTVFEALRIDATSNANSVMSLAFREGYEAFLKRDSGRA